MKIKCILVLLFQVLFAVACKRQETESSLSPKKSTTIHLFDENLLGENKLREELGLRVIKKDWVLYRAIGCQEDWKIHEDGFAAKCVFKDGAMRAVADEDYYYSGNEYYDDVEGHGWERITVHYDYKRKSVYLAYAGTNKTTEAALSKYYLPSAVASSDVSGAMAAVKKIAAGWPDGPR